MEKKLKWIPKVVVSEIGGGCNYKCFKFLEKNANVLLNMVIVLYKS